jgi:hypothetical protein
VSDRPSLRRFVDPRSGIERELRDPDGPATRRQLLRLNAAGVIDLVQPGRAAPITKAEAAAAIDEASVEGLP